MRECEIHGEGCGREEYLPGELEQCAAESSPVYNGLVLRRAVHITMHRKGVTSVNELAQELGLPSRGILYRAASGRPIKRKSSFNDVFVKLVTGGVN